MSHIRSITMAAVLLPPGLLHSTTTIFYADKDQIIAGSDGMIQNVGSTPEKGPKIHIWNNKVIVGASGLLNDGGSSYDVTKIVADALSKTNSQASLTSAVSEIETVCSNSLTRLVNSPKGPEVLNALQNRLALDLGLAYMDDQIPVFQMLWFRANTNASPIKIQVERNSMVFDPRAARAIQGLGRCDHITSFLNDRQFWRGHDPAERIELLIRKEIESVPQEVGLPIYLLKLNKSGTDWKKITE